MRIFLFDWIDEEIRYLLLSIVGYDAYNFRPLQKYLSTGSHVIAFYFVMMTVFLIVYHLAEWLWLTNF